MPKPEFVSLSSAHFRGWTALQPQILPRSILQRPARSNPEVVFPASAGPKAGHRPCCIAALFTDRMQGQVILLRDRIPNRPGVSAAARKAKLWPRALTDSTGGKNPPVICKAGFLAPAFDCGYSRLSRSIARSIHPICRSTCVDAQGSARRCPGEGIEVCLNRFRLSKGFTPRTTRHSAC